MHKPDVQSNFGPYLEQQLLFLVPVLLIVAAVVVLVFLVVLVGFLYSRNGFVFVGVCLVVWFRLFFS